VVLTIPHPGFANHNGGMVTFGPTVISTFACDRRVGERSAQQRANKRAARLSCCASTSTTSRHLRRTRFRCRIRSSGAIDGRDEILAYGLRNSVALSRSTAPPINSGSPTSARSSARKSTRRSSTAAITAGACTSGNHCSNNDRRCASPDELHLSALRLRPHRRRCSITGGYGYRGSLGALATGTYVYGIYCTGEMLAWNGSTQRLLLDTGANISSFGEDDAGEIYVVTLDGTVSRIAGTSPLGGGARSTPAPDRSASPGLER
jgi:hypothetical protein